MNIAGQSTGPGISNLRASDVKACRICLATDVKMHSLEGNHLGRCMDSVASFNYPYEGLPKYVCYECAPCLIKYYKLMQKSWMAQAALRDIFAKYGQITKTLIEQKKSQLDLKSPLDSYLLINYFYIKYDDDNNTSDFIKTNSNPSEKINIKLKNAMKEKSSVEETELQRMNKMDPKDFKIMRCEINEICSTYNSDDDEEININIPVVEVSSEDETSEGFISLKPYETNLEKSRRHGGIVSQKFQPILRQNKQNVPPQAPVDTDIQEYFDIAQIPIYRQIEEWRQSTLIHNATDNEEAFECDICHRKISHAGARAHAARHNRSIYGNVTCGVCMFCFPTAEEMRAHSEKHSRKYYCKNCRMAFINIEGAKKHKNAGCISSRGQPLKNQFTSAYPRGRKHIPPNRNGPVVWKGWNKGWNNSYKK